MNLRTCRVLQIVFAFGGLVTVGALYGWRPADITFGASLVSSWFGSVGDDLEKKKEPSCA